MKIDNVTKAIIEELEMCGSIEEVGAVLFTSKNIVFALMEDINREDTEK